MTEGPYAYLVDVVEQFLGRALPPIRQRWAGVYSQCVDPDQLVCRTTPEDGVWVVTGPGGRGMTLGPAIAEQSATSSACRPAYFSSGSRGNPRIRSAIVLRVISEVPPAIVIARLPR